MKGFDKVFRKFGQKTVCVCGAILRDPSKSPAEIAAFLEELGPLIDSGKLSGDDFDKRLNVFYGENPVLIFVGFVAFDKSCRALRLIDPATGDWLGLPLPGDKIIRIQDFESALKNGYISIVSPKLEGTA